MIRNLKDSFKARFPSLYNRYILLRMFYPQIRESQLWEDGWFRCYREGFCADKDGNPIPWLTYPAIDFIQRRIRQDFKVFEFGCGSSTLWWAGRVSKVVSCEHHMEWFDLVQKKIPSNVSLLYAALEGGEYSNKILESEEKFDVVIVDGRERVACAKNAVSRLTEDGIIIWDNTNRERYQEGFRFLFENGFKKIEFTGMTPLLVEKHETSIFYRQKNCFSI